MIMKMNSASGHHFCSSLLSSRSVVVDLGANRGGFSSAISRKFGCKCFAVEPNPDVYEKIPGDKLIKKFNCAIAAENGFSEFYVSANSEASSLCETGAASTGPIKTIRVKTITFESFLEENALSVLDLLKMDIEGEEIGFFDNISDKTLLRIRQITVEFHDFKKSASAGEVLAIIKRLNLLGFLCLRYSRPSHFHEDVLFINKKLCGLTKAQELYLIFLERIFLRIRHFFIYLQKRAERVMERIKNHGRAT